MNNKSDYNVTNEMYLNGKDINVKDKIEENKRKIR